MHSLFLLTLLPAAHAAETAGPASGPALIAGVALVVVAVAVAVFRKPADGLVFAAGMGALATVYLTSQHVVAMAGGSSICNVSSVINCDLVNTSKYSEIFGISIALYGLGFYAGMGYLAVQSRAGRVGTAPALMLLGALGAVGYDVFLAWKSWQLGAVCVFCAATWAINVILLIGSAQLARGLEGGFGAALGRAIAADAGPALVSGLVVFILGVLVVRAQEPGNSPSTAGGGNPLAGIAVNVSGRIELDGTEPVRGAPSARFTLVEFADYQCPHCGLMAPVLKKVLDKNADVKLLFKNYPLDQECNAYVQRAMHPWACNAARAAECARVQGRFWELSEAMFGNQEYLSPDDVRFMANRAGIDVALFNECVASAASLEAVKADIEGGAVAQIDGTPSIFLLGAYGEKWVKLDVGPGDGERIEAFLAAAREGKPLPAPTDPEPYPE
jgi:protein-disulfide isomerase/uncharacterized membrane protein